MKVQKSLRNAPALAIQYTLEQYEENIRKIFRKEIESQKNVSEADQIEYLIHQLEQKENEQLAPRPLDPAQPQENRAPPLKDEPLSLKKYLETKVMMLQAADKIYKEFGLQFSEQDLINVKQTKKKKELILFHLKR